MLLILQTSLQNLLVVMTCFSVDRLLECVMSRFFACKKNGMSVFLNSI